MGRCGSVDAPSQVHRVLVTRVIDSRNSDACRSELLKKTGTISGIVRNVGNAFLVCHRHHGANITARGASLKTVVNRRGSKHAPFQGRSPRRPSVRTGRYPRERPWAIALPGTPGWLGLMACQLSSASSLRPAAGLPGGGTCHLSTKEPAYNTRSPWLTGFWYCVRGRTI